MNREQRKALFYSGIGGLLEFYDFIIYALAAPILANLFFPNTDKLTSLLATFATFALGYLARPIGGIIFSHFGDKYGRKNTFLTTVVLMAISTFAMALVPSYQSIGIAGTLLIIILRVLQGLSVGGEIPGAITYISEVIPQKRGLATGIIFCFLINGITLGALLFLLLNETLSHSQLIQWGWRLLFVVGGIMGFAGFFLRRKMIDSDLFKHCENYARFPLVDVFKKSGLNFILATFIAGLCASYITVLYLFLPTYFKSVLHHVPPHFLLTNTIAILIGSLFAIVFGRLADKANKLYLIASIALVGLLLSVPIFKNYAQGDYVPIMVSISCILVGAIAGAIPSTLAELFPTYIRYSGVAISYNLGFAIFSGLAPMICLFLIQKTGVLYSPAYYLIGLSLVVLILGVVFARRNRMAWEG
jgi:MFS family permease